MAHAFDIFLWVMTGMAFVVFIALFFVKAGYGMFVNGKWGPSVDNRLGWVLMESPVFIAMCILWWHSRTPVGCRPVLFFPSFPIALLPAFVHIPAFDTRKRAYAGRDNTDGGGIQRTQCADAGRMDILRQPRRQISGIVVLHSAIHSRGVDVRIGNGREHTFRFGDTRA